jgi:type VI secretion system secreted protein Hcp
MAIYMHFDGIDGSVTSKGHEKWIDLNSLQWGVGRGISITVGSSSDREASTPSISEISVTKLMDKTSALLFQEACIGKAKKVTLHLCKTGPDSIDTYMEYILDDCMISGYSVSSGGDRPSESLSLSFAKMTMSYTPYDKSGSAETPVKAGYDLTTAKKV